MKKILVCCISSVTSSLLVVKMEAEVKARGLDVEIVSEPVAGAIEHLGDADVVLLGPQVAHAQAPFEEGGAKKVLVIDPDDYTCQAAPKILGEALAAIE